MGLSRQRSKSTLRARIGRTLRICAAFYLVIGAGCASFQRRLIYFPPVFSSGAVDELARAERLERWNAPDGRAIGWKRLSPTQPAQGRVLLMHGNGNCAFQCGHYADVIQQAAALDVFIVEYPGYADRPGEPRERTLDESADEAFRLLAGNGPVYLVGESLGTGVAAYLAGTHPGQTAGVVLFAAYNRLSAVGQHHIKIFPVSWILSERFPAEDNLRNYHGPVAVLVGGQDQVVPAKFGRRLYDGYAGPRKLWEFPEANHGTVMVQPVELWRHIIEFWQTNDSARTATVH